MKTRSRLRRSRSRAAFTLLELMVVVAILGILAALGIPVFRTFMLRSKTAEASINLSSMFRHAATYYAAERTGQGQSAMTTVGCTVSDVEPGMPNAQKQRLAADPNFRALGFSVGDYVYFTYGLATETGTGSCGGQANDPTVYTLRAEGDLDGDSITSSFELAVGSDDYNTLYHAAGVHVERELE